MNKDMWSVWVLIGFVLGFGAAFLLAVNSRVIDLKHYEQQCVTISGLGDTAQLCTPQERKS